MQSGSSPGLVPVFVFPNAVNFYLGDAETYKQVLTIYNIYNTAIRFKVLCNARDKYVVVDPEGAINPQRSLDIVIRHKDVRPANCNVTDKFRIQILDFTTKQVIGKRDITATLNVGVPEKSDDEKEHLNSESKVGSKRRDVDKSNRISKSSIDKQLSGRSGLFFMAMFFLCAVALMMPNEGDDSSLPALTLNMKLFSAFFLGIFTMFIITS